MNHLHYAVAPGFHTFGAHLLQRMRFFKVSLPQVIISIHYILPPVRNNHPWHIYLNYLQPLWEEFLLHLLRNTFPGHMLSKEPPLCKTSAAESFRRKGTKSAWNLFYKCPQTIRISLWLDTLIYISFVFGQQWPEESVSTRVVWNLEN